MQSAIGRQVARGRPAFLPPVLLNYRPISTINSRTMIRPNIDVRKASNLDFNERINQLTRQGVKIHHLGFGQSPFPVPRAATEALKRHSSMAAYTDVAGLPELRDGICAFHERYDTFGNFTSEDVVVSVGSKQMLFLILSVFNGDVLLPSPCFPSYLPQCHLAMHNTVVIPTQMATRWKIQATDLDRALTQHCKSKHKLLLLCNPDNPTGVAYSASELEDLASVCRQHGCIVVSDEIYARLNWTSPHVSIAECYPEGTVVTSSFSKWASLGGWRLGYGLFPMELSDLRQAVTGVSSQTHTCAPAPIQYAAIELLSHKDEIDDYMQTCSRVLHSVAKYTHKKLTCIGVEGAMPDSTYYMVTDFSFLRRDLKNHGIKTAAEMAAVLLEEANVAILPCGPTMLREEDELTFRLCYVNFDGAIAYSASQAVGRDKPLPDTFVQDHCYDMVTSVEAIINWCKKVGKFL